MAKPTTVAAGGDLQQRRGRSLSNRKMDMLYLVFFAIHVPVMLLVDLATLYPPSLTPALSTTLRTYYITNIGDRFFTAPPAWFLSYMYLEALYHLPASLWLIWNIPKDHPLVGLSLLVFALETALTTLTCVVDTAEWAGYSAKQRADIYSLYLPYLVLAAIMGVDAFLRVKAQVLRAAASSVDGKAKRN